MIKILAAGTAAALALHAASVVPSVTEVADVDVSVPQRALKGDRLPLRPLDCTQAGWPHYDVNCIRNPAQSDDEPIQPRLVRVIVIDRQSAQAAVPTN